MTTYCCPMRRRFLVQVVGEDPAAPEPADLIDFIDFDAKRPDNKPVIRIRFCPFCGRPATGPLRTARNLPPP